MPRDKRVVLALRRIGERTQTLELPVCREPVSAPRQYLMRISLVTYIPYQLILRRVEYVVQRYRQFYRTQRRTQMTGMLTQRLDDILPQLGTHLRQLTYRHLLQVGRRVYMTDIRIFLLVHACLLTRIRAYLRNLRRKSTAFFLHVQIFVKNYAIICVYRFFFVPLHPQRCVTPTIITN